MCQQIIASRLLLSYIFESGVQTNIQLTSYAMNLLAARGRMTTMSRLQSLLSAVISLLIAVPMVFEVQEFFYIASHVSIGGCIQQR